MRLAIILFVFLAGCRKPADQSDIPRLKLRGTFDGRIMRVIDGDSIEVLNSDNVTVRIRLQGIAAPVWSQPFSKSAKDYLEALIRGREVNIGDYGQDNFGVTIADVTVEVGNKMDEWLNYAMVRDGFAWHDKRFSKDEYLAKAEVEAREEKRGLWADPKPVPPWEWRDMDRDRK